MATRRPPASAVRPGRRAPVPDADASLGLSLALRVPVFTALTVGLALAAHVAGGGALPGAGRMLFATVAVVLTWWPLALREVPSWLVGCGVATVQGGVHVALLDPGAASAHDHLQSQPMLAAHAVAALLVTVWLARGETAVWAAVRRVLPRAAAPCPTIVLQVRLPRPAAEPAVPARPVLDRAADPRRGPPALAL